MYIRSHTWLQPIAFNTDVNWNSLAVSFDFETVDLILVSHCHMTSSPSITIQPMVPPIPGTRRFKAAVWYGCPGTHKNAFSGTRRARRRRAISARPALLGAAWFRLARSTRHGKIKEVPLLFSHFFPNNCQVHVPEGFVQCCWPNVSNGGFCDISESAGSCFHELYTVYSYIKIPKKTMPHMPLEGIEDGDFQPWLASLSSTKFAVSIQVTN